MTRTIRASLATLSMIALLAACSSGGGSTTTGGVCVAEAGDCTASSCCAGLSCISGLCLTEGSNGPGSSSGTHGTSSNGPGGTTSGQQGATTSGHGATTSGAVGPGSTTSGAVGPGSTTSGAVGTSGASSTTSGTVFCNGVQVTDSEDGTVDIATYPVPDEIRLGCLGAVENLFDGGTESLSTVGGILDHNTLSTQANLLTIFPAGCDDLGAGSAPVINPTAINPPLGASDVEDARANQLDGGTVYGIVTWIQAPYFTTKAHSGTFYLQDSSGDPASGIAIYVASAYTTDAGTSGYPATGLARGDVVAVSNLDWSPYGGTAAIDVQDQLDYTAASTVTLLGALPLPTPIAVNAGDLSQGIEPNYSGMRVTLANAPFTVTNACPAELNSP